MSKLPSLKARNIVKILHKLGFKKVRQKGSHAFFSHTDGRTTVVPIHQGRSLGKGILHSILHDIQISSEQLNSLR